MARQIQKRDISPIIAAATHWINFCLVEDRSIFGPSPDRWTAQNLNEVYEAFVEHPDYGSDDFMTKLKRQMRPASASGQQLMAEMLWALLLFPSNMKPRTKRQQIREVWGFSGQQLGDNHQFLSDAVLMGIGSGGPGFNNYRPNELEFLIALVRDLKQKEDLERRQILTNYDSFINWIDTVPREGSRQFRHMLRYFAFPDRVERISSNRDRRKILQGFSVATAREVAGLNDRELDEKLLQLRTRLQDAQPSAVLDFYEAPLREQWSRDGIVKTVGGEVPVTVPSDEEEAEDIHQEVAEPRDGGVRESIHIQAKLARIGTLMGYKIWIPRADRGRVLQLIPGQHSAFLEELPINYDSVTVGTIEQIDVLWLKGRSMVRAFEVEHTTAVYSGLLRMADLLALQPNMDIRLHIVAPDERREKVFREMMRPVFSLLDRGPLSQSCTFLSYESVEGINSLEHLAHINDSIIAEYEERPE